MTSSRPRGSSPPEHVEEETPPEHSTGAKAPVVVVVSAPWAGPSRPAPTVLRELARRWGEAIDVLLVEDPPEELLDRWGIEVLPTWLRFRAPSTDAEESGTEEEGGSEEEDGGALLLPELTGTDPAGNALHLDGPWQLELRITGAQPKHVIDAEFGPAR